MTRARDQSLGNASHRILVEQANRAIDLQSDRPLTEAVHQAGIKLEELCGGRGVCGRCRIRVSDGLVTAPTKAESRHLSPESWTGVSVWHAR